ncbi:hypothetical protein [Pseudomonas aeruginosa]|uniref:hypothetical protein n=1 Tax=Pseudomonas aeruginosa TaxID=287 RepID=UPI002E2A384C|nr:hypothetical protein [Pseudomonas aeruginosa]
MKKQILSILTLALISCIANAGYVVKVPLEMAAGGILPNGSISIGAVSNGSGNGGTGGSESGSEEGNGDDGENTPTPPNGQANCDANAVNVRAMYTFLGMGTLTSHSFINEVCTMNLHVTNRNSNPEGTVCTDNGDGTGTYSTSTASNYEGSGIRTMVESITFNGSCITY